MVAGLRFQRPTTQLDPNSSIATDKLAISSRRLAGESRMENKEFVISHDASGFWKTLPTASFPTPDHDGILRACGRAGARPLLRRCRILTEKTPNPYSVYLFALQALSRRDTIARYPIAAPGSCSAADADFSFISFFTSYFNPRRGKK
ncbi:hypothetical protein L249_5892 [Ophiocordyceps polyrhachis-furcata BCC 54312]|uniref:Uncharacterized protein n=1 Tax=Ophiocordyceps polyrhachis-furcata BCC 54312 TaxID=1330021 RepID=A0A367L0A5_9HYPO|nr:hypothetical protein L249_5892 [Ophiocordyceps polyrhachis-furcata BCC 54312]RCI07874.1 hypothetical protein L249_5892 [Ophiocordyceps polyrhachis-furcata BCC 54312]